MERDAFVLDTETTGIDTKTAKPCEISVRNVYTGEHFLTLINPGIPIPAETSAIHHICDDDVTGAHDWPTIKAQLKLIVKATPGKPLPVMVAHNAKYDRGIVGELPDVQWVCTYKCALQAWPDAPSHKNEVLRYHLKLGTLGRSQKQQSHNAGHDTMVTLLILQELLKHYDWDTLIRWTEELPNIVRIPFGKHKGMLWEEIPGGYLKWMSAQSDMDPDMLALCTREIKKRSSYR
jgi:exodeoxyribonuclease X